MSYRIGLVFALILLSGAASVSEAMAKCIANKWVVTGKLEQVVTRDARGKQVTRYHLVPKRKICIDLTANKRRKIYNVRRLEVHLKNRQHGKNLQRFLGLNVTLKGTYKPTRTRTHGLDAVVENATVMGAFDPRNGRFHNWSALQKRLDKRRPERGQPEERHDRRHVRAEERRYRDERRRRDSYERDRRNVDERGAEERRDLTKLIRKSIEELPERRARKRFQEPRSRTHRDPAFREIIAFLSDDFLQFHQMHPADVAEFYAPVVEFNGNGTISREYAIKKKFRQYRRSRENGHELLRRTLRIKKSSQFAELYHVSFEYDVMRKGRQGRKHWSRKKVRLMLDLERGAIQIVRESTRTIRNVQS